MTALLAAGSGMTLTLVLGLAINRWAWISPLDRAFVLVMTFIISALSGALVGLEVLS